jgi:hypothetical protein
MPQKKESFLPLHAIISKFKDKPVMKEITYQIYSNAI